MPQFRDAAVRLEELCNELAHRPNGEVENELAGALDPLEETTVVRRIDRRRQEARREAVALRMVGDQS